MKDKWFSFVRSFGYAWDGFRFVCKSERNMRIHLIITIIVLILSGVLSISLHDFVIILVMITLVLSLEMVNTAIERTVDYVSDEYHELARLAKDISAGAVLVASFFAVIIGLIIFIPYLF